MGFTGGYSKANLEEIECDDVSNNLDDPKDCRDDLGTPEDVAVDGVVLCLIDLALIFPDLVSVFLELAPPAQSDQNSKRWALT